MIFFTAAYLEGAIYLFYEEKSYHLVSEGHTREADAFVCGTAHFVGEAECSADEEGKMARAFDAEVVDMSRQLFGGYRLAYDVEDDETTALRDLF